MGKVVGLVGAASGKIGNIVYAVTNGIQTARVYQPVVSNPKSAKQNMQRSKGNLAGRISSFVPRTAIMGLGNNNRVRRGEFLRNILNNADVVETLNGYKAKIDNGKVVFSKGAVLLSVINPQMGASGNYLQVNLTGQGETVIPAEIYAGLQTRLVVMVYDNVSQELVEVVTKIASKPAQGETSLTSVSIIHPGGYFANVYAVPMSTSDNAAVSIDTNLAMKDDDTIAAELSINANAVIWDYGKSVYLGSSTYVPA